MYYNNSRVVPRVYIWINKILFYKMVKLLYKRCRLVEATSKCFPWAYFSIENTTTTWCAREYVNAYYVKFEYLIKCMSEQFHHNTAHSLFVHIFKSCCIYCVLRFSDFRVHSTHYTALKNGMRKSTFLYFYSFQFIILLFVCVFFCLDAWAFKTIFFLSFVAVGISFKMRVSFDEFSCRESTIRKVYSRRCCSFLTGIYKHNNWQCTH